jgi:putative hemolysin
MLQLERHLADHYPHWFRGRRARIARPLLRTVARWSRLDQVEAFLAGAGHLRGFDFVAAAAAHLQLRHHVEPAALARIPARGPLLVVANHPSGARDALALLETVGRVRQDVRIVANDLLSAIPGLDGLVLPVRILGGRPAPDSLRAVEQILQAGQCVIVFPAGEVSRLSPRGVRDGRWRRGFVRFARAGGAPVLPVRVLARNSVLFYGASALFKPAGTALLAREMYARQARNLELRIGEPMRIDPVADAAAEVRRVRRALYALGRRSGAAARGPETLAPPVDPRLVQADIERLEVLGSTSDGKRICVGRLPAGSPLLREIGRLREATFRAVGEGTGRSLDLDACDSWYEHIVLWDAPARCVAGAYRVARGARVLAERGLDGLYTASLFRYADDAIPRLAQGMELGRSFVAEAYWGSRGIDYLWQGIGAYLRRFPKVRYLFGAVSISSALPPAAREQIVAYYAHYHGAGDADAESKRPFAYRAAPPSFNALDADTAFRVLRDNLAALGAGVPMLYKQYVELCEPGGVRFLAFGIDPAFSDSVDGLVEVDLQRMHPRKRRRYLDGATPAETAA